MREVESVSASPWPIPLSTRSHLSSILWLLTSGCLPAFFSFSSGELKDKTSTCYTGASRRTITFTSAHCSVMTDRGPNFIARRIEDHKQKTQRLLKCHLCPNSTIQFRGEPEFLEHLKTNNHSASAIDAPDGPIFRSAVRQAASNA